MDFLLNKNDNKIGNYKIVKEDIKNYYIHKIPNLDLSLEEAIEWFQIPMNNDIFNLKIKAVNGALNKLIEFKIN